MWHKTFESRLDAWTNLRKQVADLAPDDALKAINLWWFEVPWRAYYLHWDDIAEWPDPWQLLSDNYYCDVARGLGMLYTITLLDRADLADAELVLTDSGDNLVQVGKRKYILNWSPDSIVNTNLDKKIKRRFDQQQVKARYL